MTMRGFYYDNWGTNIFWKVYYLKTFFAIIGMVNLWDIYLDRSHPQNQFMILI